MLNLHVHSEYESVLSLLQVIYLNETYKLEQKHIYKIESLVALQSYGLTRVQTVNSTFCKREHNHHKMGKLTHCERKKDSCGRFDKDQRILDYNTNRLSP